MDGKFYKMSVPGFNGQECWGDTMPIIWNYCSQRMLFTWDKGNKVRGTRGGRRETNYWTVNGITLKTNSYLSINYLRPYFYPKRSAIQLAKTDQTDLSTFCTKFIMIILKK